MYILQHEIFFHVENYVVLEHKLDILVEFYEFGRDLFHIEDVEHAVVRELHVVEGGFGNCFYVFEDLLHLRFEKAVHIVHVAAMEEHRYVGKHNVFVFVRIRLFHKHLELV